MPWTLHVDGEERRFMAETETSDLMILDLMLPKIDGISLCRPLGRRVIAYHTYAEPHEGIDIS
jgi:DNA-binding response OmpR family regulator